MRCAHEWCEVDEVGRVEALCALAAVEPTLVGAEAWRVLRCGRCLVWSLRSWDDSDVRDARRRPVLLVFGVAR